MIDEDEAAMNDAPPNSDDVSGTDSERIGSPDGVAAMVREFHRSFGLRVAATPDARPVTWELRVDLLREEFEEYVAAAEAADLVGVADALADMVYVIYGTACQYGIPLDDVLSEVHRANMSKRGPDGEKTRRADGKVLKGDWYSAPDVAGVLGISS